MGLTNGCNTCNSMAMCAFLIPSHSQEMPPLEQLTLRFTGSSLADASGLALMLDTEQCLARSLKSLQLWLSDLPLVAELLCTRFWRSDVVSVVFTTCNCSTYTHLYYVYIEFLKTFLRSLVRLGSWEPLAQLQLEELVLQLTRCSQVLPEAKESLILRCIHRHVATLPRCHTGTTHPPP